MIIVIEKLIAIIAQTLLSKMKKPRIHNKHEAFSELVLLPDQEEQPSYPVILLVMLARF